MDTNSHSVQCRRQKKNIKNKIKEWTLGDYAKNI
jgi:hypothetical protein